MSSERGNLGPTKGRPLRTILVEGPSRQRQAVPRVPAPQTRYKTRPRPRRQSTSYDRPAALPTTPSRRQAQAPERPLPSRRPRSTSVWRATLTARAKHKAPKAEPNERSQTPYGTIRRLLPTGPRDEAWAFGRCWALFSGRRAERKAPLGIAFTRTLRFQSPFIVANSSAP